MHKTQGWKQTAKPGQLELGNELHMVLWQIERHLNTFTITEFCSLLESTENQETAPTTGEFPILAGPMRRASSTNGKENIKPHDEVVAVEERKSALGKGVF